MGLFHYEIGNLATYSSKKEKKNKEPSYKKNLDIPFYLLFRFISTFKKKIFLKEAGRGKKRKHSSPSQILFPKTPARGLQIEFEMLLFLMMCVPNILKILIFFNEECIGQFSLPLTQKTTNA